MKNDPTQILDTPDAQALIDAERRQRPAIANPDPAPAARATTADYLQRSRDLAGEGAGEPPAPPAEPTLGGSKRP